MTRYLMSLDLETGIIAGLLQHPDAFAELSGSIKAEYFADQNCRDIIKFILDRETSDPHLLKASMPDKYRGMLEVFEDEEPVRAKSLREAAVGLKKDYAHRLLSEAFAGLAGMSKAREMAPEAICSMAQGYIGDAMRVLSSDGRGLRPFDECVRNALQYVTDVVNKKVPLTRTGIAWLDGIVGAMGETELVVIGARPSVGKSAFGLQVALAAAKSTQTAYFTMEMSTTMLTLRALFGDAGIQYTKFLGDGLTQDNIVDLKRSVDKMPSALSISDTPAPSVSRIRSEILNRPGTKLAIIDHLHIMSGEDTKGGLYQKLTEISGDLKKLAMELKMPIILLAQLNRGSAQEETEPSEHNLRDSGAIEQDADRIYLLHRPRRDDPEFADKEFEPALVLVKKNRNGSSARIKCFFEKNSMTFRACDRTDAMHDNADLWNTHKTKGLSMSPKISLKQEKAF
jgi:replicative DNA helicase